MIVNNKFNKGDVVKLTIDPDGEHLVVTDISLVYSVINRDGKVSRCTEQELTMIKKKCFHTKGYYPTGQNYLSDFIQYKFCPDCGVELKTEEAS